MERAEAVLASAGDEVQQAEDRLANARIDVVRACGVRDAAARDRDRAQAALAEAEGE